MAKGNLDPQPRSPRDILGLLRDVRVAWKLLWDRRVPIWIKGIPLLSAIYLVWPIDLLADPLLGLGQLDDIAVIWLGIKAFVLLGERYLSGGGLGDADGRKMSNDQVVDATYRVIEEDTPRRA